MNKKMIIAISCMVGIYSNAFIVNFITSIKYPDSQITILNFFVSLLYVLSILLGLKTIVTSKNSKLFKNYIIGGIMSCIFIYFATEFEHIAHDYLVLDIISGIHYLLYSLFVTPLFGFNYIFNVNYGVFSAIISLFYLVALCIIYKISKQKNE